MSAAPSTPQSKNHRSVTLPPRRGQIKARIFENLKKTLVSALAGNIGKGPESAKRTPPPGGACLFFFISIDVGSFLLTNAMSAAPSTPRKTKNRNVTLPPPRGLVKARIFENLKNIIVSALVRNGGKGNETTAGTPPPGGA